MRKGKISAARLRLHAQGIDGTRFESAETVVRTLGAVQAQDYYGGLWAVGLRTTGSLQSDVEHALASGAIVRTWPMRGTLHFVPAEDARWMLELMTPRVIQSSAARYRELELDERVFAKSAETIVQKLEGGRQLTRPDFYKVLENAGISTAQNRGLHILGHLAQKRLICFGPRAGKQQTLVLFEEWLPSAKALGTEESLAGLVRRYFIGHGPATLHDLAWWSGLTLTEVKKGLALVERELERVTIDDREYWMAPGAAAPRASAAAHLLPIYDEFTVAYRDRTAAVDPSRARETVTGLSAAIVLGAQIAGTWTRELKKDRVVLSLRTFETLSEAQRRKIAQAARRFGDFLGLTGEVDWRATAPVRRESRPRPRG